MVTSICRNHLPFVVRWMPMAQLAGDLGRGALPNAVRHAWTLIEARAAPGDQRLVLCAADHAVPKPHPYPGATISAATRIATFMFASSAAPVHAMSYAVP